MRLFGDNEYSTGRFGIETIQEKFNLLCCIEYTICKNVHLYISRILIF